MKSVIALVLGLLIGAGCRWFEIPVPSPPTLIGAALVVAMTVGYVGTDRLIARRHGSARMSAGRPADANRQTPGSRR